MTEDGESGQRQQSQKQARSAVVLKCIFFRKKQGQCNWRGTGMEQEEAPILWWRCKDRRKLGQTAHMQTWGQSEKRNSEKQGSPCEQRPWIGETDKLQKQEEKSSKK